MSEPVKLLRVPESFRSVDEVLECAKRMDLPNAIVLSELDDGALVLLDSGMSMAQTNWLIDRLKALMLVPSSHERR